MKRFIPVLIYIPLLLLLCHQLFFIVLNFASLSMTSDADINKAAVRFFFALPVILISGLWAVYQMSRHREDRFQYRRLLTLVIAIHGGLYGMVAINLLMHILQFDFENQTRWTYIIILTFIATSFIAALGLHSLAIKGSTNSAKKTSQ